jgi:hypothetical protein
MHRGHSRSHNRRCLGMLSMIVDHASNRGTSRMGTGTDSSSPSKGGRSVAILIFLISVNSVPVTTLHRRSTAASPSMPGKNTIVVSTVKMKQKGIVDETGRNIKIYLCDSDTNRRSSCAEMLSSTTARQCSCRCYRRTEVPPCCPSPKDARINSDPRCPK